MPEAEVNGIRLYYEEHGEGAPIACIHAGGSTALMWADAVEGDALGLSPAGFEWTKALADRLREVAARDGVDAVYEALVAASESPPEQREMTEAMADMLPNARTALVAGDHLIDPAAPEVLAFVQEVLERSPAR